MWTQCKNTLPTPTPNCHLSWESNVHLVYAKASLPLGPASRETLSLLQEQEGQLSIQALVLVKLLSFQKRKLTLSSTRQSFKAYGSALNWALRRATLQAIVIEHNFELSATQFSRWQLRGKHYSGRISWRPFPLPDLHGVRLPPSDIQVTVTLAELFVRDCRGCHPLAKRVTVRNSSGLPLAGLLYLRTLLRCLSYHLGALFKNSGGYSH